MDSAKSANVTPWSDPVSLAALNECNSMENDPDVKVFYTTDELFAECLGGADIGNAI